MRGRSSRARDAMLMVDVRAFGWPVPLVATHHHSTLPWFNDGAEVVSLPAVTLERFAKPGRRDALSLTGQYAAHRAFLRFAGLSDDGFDQQQWCVELRRGKDARLVRTSWSSGSVDITPLEAVRMFAVALGVGDALPSAATWERADVAYREMTLLLDGDVRADSSGLTGSAIGEIIAPGPVAVGDLLAGRRRTISCNSRGVKAVIRAAALSGTPLLILGETADPLTRLSAFPQLSGARSVARVVDQILGNVSPDTIIVITRWESFDEDSREGTSLLRAAARHRWVLPETSAEATVDTRIFAVAPRLASLSSLHQSLRACSGDENEWLRSWVGTPSFVRYLTDGIIPAVTSSALPEIEQPARSFLSALALVGPVIPAGEATAFLTGIGFGSSLESLLRPDVASLREGSITFASDTIRESLAGSVPSASAARLCRLAAAVMESLPAVDRALLFARGEDHVHAVELLAEVSWSGMTPAQVLSTLDRFPKAVLDSSTLLTAVRSRALVRCGRYREARESASALPSKVRTPIVAAIERRIGSYVAAASSLEASAEDERSGEWWLLKAELARLDERFDDAQLALADAERLGAPENALALERALLAVDRGHDPGAGTQPPGSSAHHRVEFYRADAAGDPLAAAAAARSAVDAARDFIEILDASLDLVYSLFVHGSWVDARHEALRTITLAGDSEGDRAAAGLSFTLAFLWADEGLDREALSLLEKLSRFYEHTGDRRSSAELSLISAHAALARMDLRTAREHAEKAVLIRRPLIREAAAMILDEIAWTEGLDGPAEQVTAGSRELKDRLLITRSRHGDRATTDPTDVFARLLIQWEAQGGDPPLAASRGEKLRLMRSAFGLAARGRGRDSIGLAKTLATALGISIQEAGRGSHEKEGAIVHRAATAAYPYSSETFGPVRWLLAQRNRLGQWNQSGSEDPATRETLDGKLLNPSPDWHRCSDTSLLYFEGSAGWSQETRESLVSTIATRDENYRLRRMLDQEREAASPPSRQHKEGIIGRAPAILELIAKIDLVAQRDVAVCILGESGTGKELFARAVHQQSPRRSRPFTPVNCAALPENLIESELFGHVRGAFTGADRDRPGLIESSEGGTLFLDEIGELPLPAQAKLLRFLQEGEIRRVGDSVTRKADVRIVAATNRKLDERVDEGAFREDLYYRVKGIDLEVPPLRERGSDVILLAQTFLAEEHRRHKGGADRLESEVELLFQSYQWPGNVRELQNTVRASHALAGTNRAIDLEHLPSRLRGTAIIRVPSGTYFEELIRFRKKLLEDSLTRSAGNQNQAAKILGISRQALAYQIRELGISIRA